MWSARRRWSEPAYMHKNATKAGFRSCRRKGTACRRPAHFKADKKPDMSLPNINAHHPTARRQKPMVRFTTDHTAIEKPARGHDEPGRKIAFNHAPIRWFRPSAASAVGRTRKISTPKFFIPTHLSPSGGLQKERGPARHVGGWCWQDLFVPSLQDKPFTSPSTTCLLLFCAVRINDCQ